MKLGWGFLWLAVVVVGAWAKGKIEIIIHTKSSNNMTEMNDTVAEIDARQAVPGLSTSAPKTFISRPVDCADHLMRGEKTSGIYEIYPFTCTCEGRKLTVWCDMETDGGGWTVFLSRQKQTPQLEFNRTWNEYKEFFGNATGEYWMGNENLHAMTNSRSYAGRVEMQVTTGGSSYQAYGSFRVDSEMNRYRLMVSGSSQGNVNLYFTSQNYKYFTTFDQDNDNFSGGNSAVKYGGGWWYAYGYYFHPTHNNFTDSLLVSSYRWSNKLRVTKLQVMIRPQICDSSFKTIHLKDKGCTSCAELE